MRGSVGVCCRVITCRGEVRYTRVTLPDKQPDTSLRVACVRWAVPPYKTQ